jgi:hypothetical protein
MCGATSQQKEIEASQAAFYDTLTANYKTAFGQSSAILNTLTAHLEPIFAKGPDQEGFGAAEKTALETNATEGVARNFQQAKQYVAEGVAARGGDSFIPSGQDSATDASLASSALSERSGLENQIIQADFSEGRQIWQQAAQGLGEVAASWNPNATGGVANQSGTAASTTANEIAMASNSMWNTAIGAVGGVGAAAATRPAG